MCINTREWESASKWAYLHLSILLLPFYALILFRQQPIHPKTHSHSLHFANILRSHTWHLDFASGGFHSYPQRYTSSSLLDDASIVITTPKTAVGFKRWFVEAWRRGKDVSRSLSSHKWDTILRIAVRCILKTHSEVPAAGIRYIQMLQTKQNNLRGYIATLFGLVVRYNRCSPVYTQ